MSSALAVILAAAMAIPENGPVTVSGEMKWGLDLRGEWEVTWRTIDGATGDGNMKNGSLRAAIPDRAEFAILDLEDFTDEGDGKLRVNWAGGQSCGIYQYRDNSLFICWRLPGKGRPTCFHTGQGQELFILQRVKPRK